MYGNDEYVGSILNKISVNEKKLDLNKSDEEDEEDDENNNNKYKNTMNALQMD